MTLQSHLWFLPVNHHKCHSLGPVSRVTRLSQLTYYYNTLQHYITFYAPPEPISVIKQKQCEK